MSRIVLATIGSFGDLHPKIAIALELRKRGHTVIFATHQEYRSKIEALGFEFQRMRPDNTALNDPQEMARMMDLKTGTEYIIRNWVGANLRETYTDLINTAQDADLIIAGEGVLAARLVAEKLGIPWAFAVLQPASFLSVYDPSVLPVFPVLAKLRALGSIVNRGVVILSKIIAKSWAEPIHQLRRELGLPSLVGNPFIDDKFSPYLVLAMFSFTFAQPRPDWPAKAQALRAGRPTLVMPYSHDQPDNAARVERLGTSRIISRQSYTAVKVAKHLRQLLENPNYTAKATAIARIIQTENGISVACDAIEKQLLQ
ncbi:glycosyltransferase [Fortiea contorta]|uniref:glycosyltransferase n=1 Tax=Fortiea contorta TaxID=1892405 RepID=UPI000349CCEC|nr:glycosyltransferase [Fortiea contorta]